MKTYNETKNDKKQITFADYTLKVVDEVPGGYKIWKYVVIMSVLSRKQVHIAHFTKKSGRNNMYIIITTNIYGVDEAPVLTDDKESANEAMRELFIYGLKNQKPEILEEFATKKKIIEEFDSYEVLKRS